MNSALPTASILPLRVSEVSYAVKAKYLVKNLSFELANGPLTILLGPNGAGKSITLRLCHGLLQPTAGKIQWRNGARNSICGRQAMVFQHPVLLRRSAAQNINYALSLRKTPRKERPELIRAALEKVGLSAFADQPARALSGGEQQRLALARAWVLQPQILFLDEPTSTLDPAATHAIEEVIRTFQEMGTKIVMTTHDLGQARRLADEILFLHQGRLLEHTSGKTFFNQPESLEARAFISGELLW